jgi:spore germination protein GerM
MNKKQFLIILAALMAAGTAAGILSCGRGKREVKAITTAYLLYSDTDRKKDVFIYFGDPDKEGFKVLKGQIFDTPKPVNRVKQAVMLLLNPAPQGFVSFIPEGVTLRDAYIDSNNTCYVDFSKELSTNNKSGTSGEYFAAYSIVNTIMRNFTEISGVRIMIDGKEAETMAGHIKIDGVLKAR